MNTQQILYSFFDTACRFYAGAGEPASPIPDFDEVAEGDAAAALGGNVAEACGESGSDARRESPAPPVPASAAAESPAEALERVAAAVRACKRCPLALERTSAVPGEGAASPLALVIGEGPGADEDRLARPFVGKSGQLLDKMLSAISLSRERNAYIANVVKCRPPGNRDPLPEEAAACIHFLQEQIEALRPRAILVVGRVAAKALLDTEEGIGRLRGRFFDYRGIPLMATYHPSALLRNESLKRPAWEDLKAFRERLRELAPGYEQEFADGIGAR